MIDSARVFLAPDFLALTIGLVTYFLSVTITRRSAFLQNYNIPEPVTGGFIAALTIWAIYSAPETSGRTRFLAGFITTTSGFRFSVQTAIGGPLVPMHPSSSYASYSYNSAFALQHLVVL